MKRSGPKIREVARDVLAKALAHSGASAARQRKHAAAGEVCVLGLHRVLSPAERPHATSQYQILLDDTLFEAMLEHLAKRFHLLTLDEFMSRKQPSGKRPAALLTFDDGWGDNYTTAFPLLKRVGVPATIFVATDYIGSGRTFWIEQLLRASASDGTILERAHHEGLGFSDADELIEILKRMPSSRRDDLLRKFGINPEQPANGDRMLTWEQLREMAAAGVSFASHTASHPLLTYEDDTRVRQELTKSRAALERALGRKVKALAYPNGDFDARVQAIAREAGYECAFTTARRWFRQGDDRLAIPRMLLQDGNMVSAGQKFSPAVFEYTLAGWR